MRKILIAATMLAAASLAIQPAFGTTFAVNAAGVATYGRTTSDGTGTILIPGGMEVWFSIHGDSLKVNATTGNAAPLYVSVDGGAWANPGSWTTGSYQLSPELGGGMSDADHQIRFRVASANTCRLRNADAFVVTSSGGTASIGAHTSSGTYERVLGTLGTTYWHTTLTKTAVAAGWSTPSMASMLGSTVAGSSCRWGNAVIEAYIATDVTTLWIFGSFDGGLIWNISVDGYASQEYTSGTSSGSYGFHGPFTIPGSGQRLLRVSGVRDVDALMVNGSGFPSVSSARAAGTHRVFWLGDSQIEHVSGTTNRPVYGWDMIADSYFHSWDFISSGVSGEGLAVNAGQGQKMIPTAETGADVTGLIRGETLTQGTTGATCKVSRPGIVNNAGTSSQICIYAVSGSPDGVNDWTGGTSGKVVTPSGVITGKDRVHLYLDPLVVGSDDIIILQYYGNDRTLIGTETSAVVQKYYEAFIYSLLDDTSAAHILVVSQLQMAVNTDFAAGETFLQNVVTTVNDARVTFVPTTSFFDPAGDTKYEDGAHGRALGFAATFGGSVAGAFISAQPSDGDTITITGTDAVAKTYEFDSGGGVTGSNVAVTIGGDADATITALGTALFNQTGVTFRPLSLCTNAMGAVGRAVQLKGVSTITKSGANITVASPAATGWANILDDYLDPTPTAPSGLTAAPFSTTALNLAWTDNSSNETFFEAQVATDSGFTSIIWSDSAIAAGSTAAQPTGLTQGTYYYCRVRAKGSSSDSSWTTTANSWTYFTTRVVYVDDANGNDSRTYGQAHVISTPWKTINKFLSHADSQSGDTASIAAGTYAETGTTYILFSTNANGKNMTLQRRSADAVVDVQTSSATLLLYADTNVTSGTFTVDGLQFHPTAFSSGNCVRNRGGTGSSVAMVIQNCTFDIGAGTGDFYLSDSITTGNGRSTTIDGCTATVTGHGFTWTGGNLTITDSTITCGTASGSYYGVRPLGTTTALRMTDSTINYGTVAAHAGTKHALAVGTGFGAGTAVSNIVIDGCTFTSYSASAASHTANVLDGVVNVRITNSTFAHPGGASAGQGGGLFIGNDSQSAVGSGVTGTILIQGCAASSATSHSVLIGGGCDKAVFLNNRIDSTGDIGLVIKAEDVTITGNRAQGHRPFYIKGGKRGRMRLNTINMTVDDGANGALEWVTDTDTCTDWVVIDNIIAATAGDYALRDASNTAVNMRLDYNLYMAGSAGLSFISNTAQADLTELQALWVEYANAVYDDNDAHSIAGTPSFSGTDVSNSLTFMAIPFGSPARGAASDGRSDIGGYQRLERQGGREQIGKSRIGG